MNIQAVNNITLRKNFLKNTNNNVVTNPNPEVNTDEEQQYVFAHHLCFRGVESKVSPLLKDYKKAVQLGHQNPIETFIKMESTKDELEVLAKNILSDEILSFDFIKSITEHPRKTKLYYNALKEKLNNNSCLLDIYSPTSLYRNAYNNYIEQRVNNAESVSELLQIRPDWKEEVLLQKHRELYHNDDFELGFVPNEIGAENFSPIILYLRKYFDYGFKTKDNIPDYSINGKNFKFEKLIDGRSDKNVFLITTPEKQKYIIKMADEFQRGLNKPFSIGTCSIIDQYLTKNNCRNSAPLRYYNHNTNTAIYDFIEHETTEKIHNFAGFVERMPDFSDLGLYHSDTVGSNNYFKLSSSQNAMKHTFDYEYGVEHSELVSVDNDHVTFNLHLSPINEKYHRYLPTGMQMFN